MGELASGVDRLKVTLRCIAENETVGGYQGAAESTGGSYELR